MKIATGLRIGIVGFGTFGQFIARTFARSGKNRLYASSRTDYTAAAQRLGVEFYSSVEAMVDAANAGDEESAGLTKGLDVLIISTSILSFERVVTKLVTGPRGSGLLDGILVVDVLSVKIHPKTVLQRLLPKSCDIVCCHPMFGPESGKDGWAGLPYVYEIVRANIDKPWRVNSFLNLWRSEGCRMVNMTCEAHDQCAAGSQFITHFTGRVLSRMHLQSTPINTKG